MAALSKPTVGGTDYAARIGLLFDAFNNGNYQFPATQVPSADPNTLDDYEEGTWTPSLGGTTTYTTQVGVYTKIGRLVHLGLHLVINAIGTGATGTITGRPFAPSSALASAGPVGYFGSSATNLVFAALNMNAGSSQITVSGLTAAAAGVTSPVAVFGNSAELRGSLSHIV